MAETKTPEIKKHCKLN